MAKTPEIRHRCDGSIDTSFYMDRARRIRSHHALALLGRADVTQRKEPGLLKRIFG